jgi:hypothetical protein
LIQLKTQNEPTLDDPIADLTRLDPIKPVTRQSY